MFNFQELTVMEKVKLATRGKKAIGDLKEIAEKEGIIPLSSIFSEFETIFPGFKDLVYVPGFSVEALVERALKNANVPEDMQMFILTSLSDIKIVNDLNEVADGIFKNVEGGLVDHPLVIEGNIQSNDQQNIPISLDEIDMDYELN